MKKFFSVMLAVLMLVSVVPMSFAAVVDSGKCGENVSWKLNSDGLLTLSGTGKMYDYVTQSEYGELTMDMDAPPSSYANLKIGVAPWNALKKSIKKIKVDSRITHIGSRCFAQCLMLTELALPEGVESIGNFTFHRCTNLEKVTLPDSLKTIGGYAFYACESLKTIYFGTGIEEIGRWAFMDSIAIKDVYIKDLYKWLKISYVDGRCTPTSYGANLYVNGELLTELVITADMCPIGDFALEGCGSLRSVTYPTGVSDIGGKGVFMRCPNLETVIVPDNITTLGWLAFDESYNIRKLVLGKGIEEIRQFTFNGAYNMNIFFTGTEEEWKGIYKSVDNGCIKTAPVHFGTTEHVAGATEGYISSDPDCVNGGWYYEYTICTVCECSFNEKSTPVPADPDAHNFDNWVKKDEENHQKICKNDPSHKTLEAHTWDGGYIRNQSTFTQNGEKVYTCTVCGEDKVEILDKLPPLVATDIKTNISVFYIDTTYEDTINVVVEVIDDSTIKVSLLKKTYSSTTAVDIDTQIKGKSVQPSTPVEVQIPLPEGYKANATQVYHLDDEGNTEKMNIAVEDGIISFETDGFSKYVIVDTSTEVKFELGKIDGDDKIKAADARLALRAAVGLEKYTPFSREFSAADVNNDGKITSADARSILRAAVGLEKL